MPNVTGVDFMKKVKELYPDIVRILFTGYADMSEAEEAVNSGDIYRCLTKPWGIDELKSVLHQAVRHHDLMLEDRRLKTESLDKTGELELMQKKLKGLYAAQKDFNSTVSSELKAPLASIKMAVDMMLSEMPGPLNEEQKKFLEKAKTNTDRLNRLISDVLDLSKMESGKLKTTMVETDLNEQIQQVVDMEQYAVKGKGLYLKTELDDMMQSVIMDGDRIQQVLSQLISNAVKNTGQGGITVTSHYRPDQNHVLVAVQDTGSGIRPEELPGLFQTFRSSDGGKDSSTKRAESGLAICKAIIDYHGGKIWADSDLDQGCRICFSLPIKERRF
jgi:signal transduction histidine kinase